MLNLYCEGSTIWASSDRIDPTIGTERDGPTAGGRFGTSLGAQTFISYVCFMFLAAEVGTEQHMRFLPPAPK